MNNKNKLVKFYDKNEIIMFFKSPLLYILLICGFVQRIVYNFIEKYSTFPDTVGYMDYSQNIFKGEISKFRTPLYPYFIKLVRKLFGEENIYNSIVFMQYTLFFVSIIFFYLTIKKLCENKFLTSISTIIYGASPFIFLWNNIILTESLAMCAIILLSYMTISYLKKPNILFAYFIGIYVFGLIMLRPAFIYVAAIYLVFWIVRYFTNKSERKNNVVGIISMVACLILVLIYCLMVKVQHGNFELTNVSLINKLSSVIRSESYAGGDNKDITNMINNYLDGKNMEEDYFDCAKKIIDNFDRDEINEYCSSVYKNSTKEYIYYTAKNLLELGNSNIGTRYTEYTLEYSSLKYKVLCFYETLILPINFIHLYIILIISTIILIVQLFKNKKIVWILAFLLSMIFGSLFITIVGSPGEYRRLFSSSIPLVIILITYLAYLVLSNVNFRKINDTILKIN